MFGVGPAPLVEYLMLLDVVGYLMLVDVNFICMLFVGLSVLVCFFCLLCCCLLSAGCIAQLAKEGWRAGEQQQQQLVGLFEVCSLFRPPAALCT
jgi:hypothetical protein